MPISDKAGEGLQKVVRDAYADHHVSIGEKYIIVALAQIGALLTELLRLAEEQEERRIR